MRRVTQYENRLPGSGNAAAGGRWNEASLGLAEEEDEDYRRGLADSKSPEAAHQPGPSSGYRQVPFAYQGGALQDQQAAALLLDEQFRHPAHAAPARLDPRHEPGLALGARSGAGAVAQPSYQRQGPAAPQHRRWGSPEVLQASSQRGAAGGGAFAPPRAPGAGLQQGVAAQREQSRGAGGPSERRRQGPGPLHQEILDFVVAVSGA